MHKTLFVFAGLNFAGAAWNVCYWPNPINVAVSVFCVCVGITNLVQASSLNR